MLLALDAAEAVNRTESSKAVKNGLALAAFEPLE
jgi:hypothetical protein